MYTNHNNNSRDHEETIRTLGNMLQKYMNSSKSLVTLVYAIAEHVPHFGDEKYLVFWQNEVCFLI